MTADMGLLHIHVLQRGLVAVRCLVSTTALAQYMRVEIVYGLNGGVVHVATGKITIDFEMPARILPGCPSYVFRDLAQWRPPDDLLIIRPE